MAREIGGAESSTTREKAALRSNTSAHHAARAGSGGRTIHTPSLCPKCAQSRGASVREASMYATHSPRSTADSTTWRSSVSLPVAPTTSVSRPRGSPPDASARSSASNPVGSPAVSGSGGGRSARSALRVREVALPTLTSPVLTAIAVELMGGSQCRVHAVPEETPKTCARKEEPSTVIR
jgi:hypothetical protein